ncbi:MAG: FkbM family methyltransferase [Baekduia sp.]
MPLVPPDPTDVTRRVALTTAVRDTDAIPKVPNAGEVERVGDRPVQVMHNGLMIDEACYGGPFMTDIIKSLRGHHEPQEELVFHRLLERLAQTPGDRPPAMVELGAYWAYYSMWFQRALPGATTIMIEPDPHNLEVGKRNFALNGLDGVFHQAAVGATSGDTMWIACESDDRTRQVPIVTLDGLIADNGLDRIDLVLCDTQGAELHVLAAARDALRERRIRFLVLSTHHQIFSGDALTHQRCLAFLRDVGAHIIAEHSIAESCSGDGLIAASMDRADRDLTVDVSHVRARDSLFGEPEYEVDRARGWRGPVRRYGGRVVVRAQTRLRRER